MLQRRLPGHVGGKSGYTSKAGRTFVGAAERDGRRLIVSMMDIGGNTYRPRSRCSTGAFANADRLRPVGRLAEPTGPAPTFDRTILALPAKGKLPANRESGEARAADAPTAPIRPRSLAVDLPDIPVPALPSPLTLLTMLMAVVVVLRIRVYWIGYRSRSAWITLDDWAAAQARSARRRGPADRLVRTADRAAAATVDEQMLGAASP